MKARYSHYSHHTHFLVPWLKSSLLCSLLWVGQIFHKSQKPLENADVAFKVTSDKYYILSDCQQISTLFSLDLHSIIFCSVSDECPFVHVMQGRGIHRRRRMRWWVRWAVITQSCFDTWTSWRATGATARPPILPLTLSSGNRVLRDSVEFGACKRLDSFHPQTLVLIVPINKRLN